jgi:hypothetical protein
VVRRGAETVGPGAFIYRLEQDKWTGVFGVLRDETGPIYAQAFTRKAAE